MSSSNLAGSSLDVRSHSATRQAFMVWLALPSDQRQPPTLAEFCEAWNVTRQATWTWRRDPRFQQEFARHVRACVLPRVANILEAVLTKAEGGSFKHCELALKTLFPIFRDEEKERPVIPPDELLRIFQTGRLAEMLDAHLRAAIAQRAAQRQPVEEAQVVDPERNEESPPC